MDKVETKSGSVEFRQKSNSARPSSILLDLSDNGRRSSLQSTEPETPSGQGSQLWKHIVNHWEEYTNKKSFIKDLIKRGIPRQQRAKVWLNLSGLADSLLIDRYNSVYADQLRRQSVRLPPLADNNSSDDDIYESGDMEIRCQIIRGLRFWKLLLKDESLHSSMVNVLKALLLHKPNLRVTRLHCLLLALFIGEPSGIHMSEAEAFVLLDFLIENVFPPQQSNKFTNSTLLPFLLDKCLPVHVPQLSNHIESLMPLTTLLNIDWLSGFSQLEDSSENTILFVELAVRLLDGVFSEGKDFLLRVCIAFLKFSTDSIRPLSTGPAIQQYFLREVPEIWLKNGDAILSSAYAFSLEKDTLKLHNEDYETFISNTKSPETKNCRLEQNMAKLEKEFDSICRLAVRGIRFECLAEELTHKLAMANDTIHHMKSMGGDGSVGSTSGDQALALIQRLQTELVNLRMREAENNSAHRELRDRHRQLEELNVELAKNPSDDVAALQEELIAVKLREAEANLSLKEVKKRVKDLETLWEEKQQTRWSRVKSPVSNPDDPMTMRLKESAMMIEMNEMRQKLMEMEAQTQISVKQSDRREAELTSQSSRLKASLEREREMRSDLGALERKVADIETKRKEDGLMWRLREMELSSLLAELKQKVAGLESQNQEMVTATEIGSDSKPQNMTQQQEELYHLRMQSRRWMQESIMFSSSSTSGTGHMVGMSCHAGGFLSTAGSEYGSPMIQSLSSSQHVANPTLSHPSTPSSGCDTSMSKVSSANSNNNNKNVPLPLRALWKDIPKHIMTDSIGPLEDLCFQPDDPLITSIYLEPPRHSSRREHKNSNSSTATTVDTEIEDHNSFEK